MTDLPENKQTEREKRDARLAENLRANLRRRKQAARKTPPVDTKPPSS